MSQDNMSDIFKLVFEHDLRLDDLRERSRGGNRDAKGSSLEEFLKPDPTYSKFYLTGTELNEEKFGLNRLKGFPAVRGALQQLVGEQNLILNGNLHKLDYFLDHSEFGVPAVITKSDHTLADFSALTLDKESNIGHRKEELREVLQEGGWVLYKEKNHHGYDLHLFSKENIYTQLFYPFRELVSPEFRFFSMNGKRITSERKFYFETWVLHRPPHGAEEVFPDTRI